MDYTPKARLVAGTGIGFCSRERPLKALYLLGETSAREIAITPVKGQALIATLAKNSFLLDMEDKELLTHQFGQLTALARQADFYRLDYPRDYSMLARVREVILLRARQDG